MFSIFTIHLVGTGMRIRTSMKMKKSKNGHFCNFQSANLEPVLEVTAFEVLAISTFLKNVACFWVFEVMR